MDDRYTRIAAIESFGIDVNFSKLHDKKIVIVGVGGLGSIIADQLARLGVGTLFLFDMDIVCEVNLNRMGFNPVDLGEKKVELIKKKIFEINPNVKVVATHGDIMSWKLDEIFNSIIKQSDIVMMGLDNFPARIFVNQKCIRHKKILINAGVSRSALTGYVQPIIPGKTACLNCSSTISNNDGKGSNTDCTASLPTTMAIIASIQVQESLKILLNFGTPIEYQTYNTLSGNFSQYKPQRDPECHSCSKI